MKKAITALLVASSVVMGAGIVNAVNCAVGDAYPCVPASERTVTIECNGYSWQIVEYNEAGTMKLECNMSEMPTPGGGASCLDVGTVNCSAVFHVTYCSEGKLYQLTVTPQGSEMQQKVAEGVCKDGA